MNRTAILLSSLLALGACDGPPEASVEAAKSPAPAPAAATPDVDPASTEKAVQELEGWEAIIEVMHDESLAVQWTVGVRDDGSKRYGLAESVCMELGDRGLVHDRTSVRVVDREEVMSNGGDFRAASLGGIRCASSERIDP